MQTNWANWIIWVNELFNIMSSFLEKCELSCWRKKGNVGHPIIFRFITFNSDGWSPLASSLSLENPNEMTFWMKKSICVLTFKLCDHIIECHTQSMTIKLTWMINYHLRSSSSCFVSFPENNTLEMISVPVSFILVFKSNYNTFHNSTSNRHIWKHWALEFTCTNV